MKGRAIRDGSPLIPRICPGPSNRESVAVRRIIQNSALHLLNCVGDVNSTRAGLGAVEDRAATPNAGAVAQNIQTFGAATVAAIEDEPVRVHDRRWANPFSIGPHRGTRSGACAAEDAFGRLIEALALLRRLQTLGARRGFIVDEIGFHFLI